jgi:hypothetical protein
MDTRASRCAIWKLHAPPSREADINPNPKKGGYPAPHQVTFLTGPNRDFPKWRRHQHRHRNRFKPDAVHCCSARAVITGSCATVRLVRGRLVFDDLFEFEQKRSDIIERKTRRPLTRAFGKVPRPMRSDNAASALTAPQQACAVYTKLSSSLFATMGSSR